MENMNNEYQVLNDEEYMNKHHLTFVSIVAIIIIVFTGVFGYIVGYDVGREYNPETTVVTEATEVTEPTVTIASEPVAYTPDVLDIDHYCKPLRHPITTETVPVIDQDELEMLACVIYQEAGGNRSCDDCRRYVADIVLNRIAHPEFPNTMEEVLTAHGQYGMFYYTGIKWSERSRYDIEQEAVERAYQIAEEVLSGQHSELYGEGYIWQARFVQGTEGFWCCGHFYGR